MLDARYVADHLDEVRAQLARRGSEYAEALDGVASLVTSRRELTRKTELLQGERNTASDAMAKLAKSGDKEGMAARRDELKALSERVKGFETELAGIEAQIEEVLLNIPNVPHASVPDGQTEDKNVVVRTWGEQPSFAFEPKPHYELGEKLGILDFERAAMPCLSPLLASLAIASLAVLRSAWSSSVLRVSSRREVTRLTTPSMASANSLPRRASRARTSSK